MIGGIIAGALEGGAKATYGIASDTLKQQGEERRMRLDQELAIERDKAITRNRLSAQREDDLSRLDPAGEYGKARAAQRATDAKQDTDAAVEREGRIRRTQGEADRENTTAYLKTPGLREATRAKAQDSRVASPTEGIQAQVLQEQLAQLRARGVATKDLEAAIATGDEDKIDAARRRVGVHVDPLGVKGRSGEITNQANALLKAALELKKTDPDSLDAAEMLAEAARLRASVQSARGVKPQEPGPKKDRLDQFKVIR